MRSHINLHRQHIHLIGYASGIGGPDPRGGDGPLVLQKSPYLKALNKKGIRLYWEKMIHSPLMSPSHKLQHIIQHCQDLAHEIARLTQEKKFFLTLGGDHTCAIGTWRGARYGFQKPLGLVWIDAHMDSHTPETSLTGNIHGMPLAALLGSGYPELAHLLSAGSSFHPQNVCLIGTRSFESAEEQFLISKNVRIFYMDEVKKRGIEAVMAEAIELVTQHTEGFGISLDLDSIDPRDAPGTDVAEPDGISGEALCNALKKLINEPRLIGFEIAEFDSHRDRHHQTEKLIAKIIQSITVDEID